MELTFEPALPVHTYQRIVDQIEHAIVSGEIPVGARLSSERDLMVQFGVSRPTVREALRILQSMGLLESKPGTRGGPVVLAPSAKNLSRSLRAMLGTDAMNLSELIEYRVMLEGTASQLAAFRHTTEQLGRMAAAIERMEAEALVDGLSFTDADLEFHEAVWDASGNQVIRLSGEAASGVLRALMQRQVEHSPQVALSKQANAVTDRELFSAIAARDAAAASRIARQAVADRFAPLLESQADREALHIIAGAAH